MRKILIAPSYGAGWSTWNSGPTAKYMLTYQPIIDFIESGGQFGRGEDHPLLTRLKDECRELFNEGYVCVLGASDLKVVKVNGKVRVSEYDGAESFVERDDDDGWM